MYLIVNIYQTELIFIIIYESEMNTKTCILYTCCSLYVVACIRYTYNLHTNANILHTLVCIQLFAYSSQTCVCIQMCQYYTICMHSHDYIHYAYKWQLFAYSLHSYFCKGYYKSYITISTWWNYMPVIYIEGLKSNTNQWNITLS